MSVLQKIFAIVLVLACLLTGVISAKNSTPKKADAKKAAPAKETKGKGKGKAQKNDDDDDDVDEAPKKSEKKGKKAEPAKPAKGGKGKAKWVDLLALD